MGFSKGERITPSWVMTLGAIADTQAEHPHYFIRVSCRKCREHRDLDIPALIEKVGRDFTLLDKRTRCRITPGLSRLERLLLFNRLLDPQHVQREEKPDVDGARLGATKERAGMKEETKLRIEFAFILSLMLVTAACAVLG